jgi:tetratricopeptide (TPR) repeat protein
MQALLVALEASPGKRLVTVAAATTLVAGLAAFAGWKVLRPVDEACAAPAAQLDRIWNDRLHRDIKQAFAASGRPGADRMVLAIHNHFLSLRTDWSRQYERACQQMDRQASSGDPLFRLRMQCLDEKLEEAFAVTSLLAKADAETVDRSLPVTHGLELRECVQPRERPAVSELPQLQSELDRLRSGLASLRALYALGKYKQVVDTAAPLLERTRTLNNRSIEAHLLLLTGRASGHLGRMDVAWRDLEAAALAGEAAREDVVVARAWTFLSGLAGLEQKSWDKAARYLKFAYAAVERLGPESPYEGELKQNEGVILAVQGRYDEARRAMDQARVLLIKSRGPNHVDVGTSHNNLALVASAQGRYLEAIEHLRRALEMRQALYGPDHIEVAAAWVNLAGVQRKLGRLDEAWTSALRALEINEASLGREHAAVGRNLISLAMTALGRGDLAAAKAHAERSLAIHQKEYGDDSPRLSPALAALAEVELESGAAKLAVDRLEDALRRAEKQYGPSHEKVALILEPLGKGYLALDLPHRAAAVLDRAHAIRTGFPGDPVQLAAVRFLLADALVRAKGDVTRAVSLAEQALPVLEAQPGRKALAREVRDWLTGNAHRRL